MARKMKLWCGLVYCGPSRVIRELVGDDCAVRQHACLVKATSQKRAAELLNEHVHGGFTVGEIRTYWGQTRNKTDLAVAEQSEDEEGVWVVPGKRHNITDVEQYTRLV